MNGGRLPWKWCLCLDLPSVEVTETAELGPLRWRGHLFMALWKPMNASGEADERSDGDYGQLSVDVLVDKHYEEQDQW